MQVVSDSALSGKESDDALIDRYRVEGDVAALDLLVQRHATMLTRYLGSLLGSSADVDDAFQAVWFKIVRRPEAYRRNNFRGWLLRVAHNVAIDMYRRRRPDVSLDAENESGGSLADILVSPAAGPRESAASSGVLALVAGLVEKLPEKQREVFVMRVAGEMTFREIAETLGVPINTALGRMHYAVTRLRAALADNPDAWSDEVD